MTKRHDSRARYWLLADGLAAVAVPLGSKHLASEFLLDELTRMGASASEKALSSAFERAERRLEDAISADSSLRGVGACGVATVSGASGVTIAHLGDCRAHLYRDGVLVSATEDHRLPVDPRVVTRALGMPGSASPELSRWSAEAGDVVLLTAVVHDLLSNDEIGSRLVTTEPEATVSRLVDAAIERGAEDDVVAVLTIVGGVPTMPQAGYSRRPRRPNGH